MISSYTRVNMWLCAQCSCSLKEKKKYIYIIKIQLNNPKKREAWKCVYNTECIGTKRTESYKRFYIAIAIIYTSRLKERIFEIVVFFKIYYERFEICAFSGASILPWKRANCKNFRAVNPRQELQMKDVFYYFYKHLEGKSRWQLLKARDDQCTNVKIPFSLHPENS